MKIRLATEADLAQLVAISEASGSAAHWTRQQWLDIFHTGVPARLAWIMEAHETHACGFLVAQIGLAQLAGEWELENIAVLPEFRRHGLGRELLQALLADARKQGAERILLEVRESNLPAFRLYSGAGFQQLGIRPNYYQNPTENALIMVHIL